MGRPGMLPSEMFGNRWRQKQGQKTRARKSFLDFSIAVPESQTGRLDFERFPHVRELYSDTGDLHELVVDKGTQVGVSTIMLRWVLWLAGEMGLTSMYVFPTSKHVYNFSDQRVKPIIQYSDYLGSLVAHDDPQSKGLRKLGRGYVHFVGSQSVNDLDSVPANALVFDEYDELNQNNIPVAEARVGAAENPMFRRVGVPTLQGVGIDRYYRRSDMRRWMVKCEHCNEWQQITWANVRYEEKANDPGEYTGWRVCEKCEKPIDTRNGEWVPEHPERSLRGYHAPRTIVQSADIGTMVKARLSDSEASRKNHYNRDLALPFETPDSRLSYGALESCRRDGLHLVESYVGDNWVTMGIDQSTTRGLHVRISEHTTGREKRSLFIGNITAAIGTNPDAPDESALRQLAKLMVDYGVHMACIDHLPDGLFARAFCAAHPGRAYMVAFNTAPTAKELIVFPPPTRPDKLVVTVRRTDYITMTLDLFRAQRNLIPADPLPTSFADKLDYGEHLRNMVKQKLTDSWGRQFYGYEEAGPVDFLMCELYDLVATDTLSHRFLEGQVAEVTREQEVQPDNPTPDLNDWDGRPWREDGGDTYGEGWSDEYR